jgi:short subunit dehydrogenase-like uncharacterized protein
MATPTAMIATLVKQCCEDEAHYAELSGQILIFVKANAASSKYLFLKSLRI